MRASLRDVDRIRLVRPASLAARQDKTEAFISAQLREQNIPGLALAIVKDGKVIKAAGYGYAEYSNGTFQLHPRPS